MGTLVTVVAPSYGGGNPANHHESYGGIKFVEKYAEYTMGATYATGGDTVPLPDAPPGGVLRAVEIVAHTAGATYKLRWDGSTSEPEILAYVEDGTTGISAELANASAALAAVVLLLRFTYRVGA